MVDGVYVGDGIQAESSVHNQTNRGEWRGSNIEDDVVYGCARGQRSLSSILSSPFVEAKIFAKGKSHTTFPVLRVVVNRTMSFFSGNNCDPTLSVYMCPSVLLFKSYVLISL